MEAKNKAIELVNKFQRVAQINFLPTPAIERRSIKCALIAVDEILESKPSYNYWDTYSDETPSAITFWNEVKNELNSMLDLNTYNQQRQSGMYSRR